MVVKAVIPDQRKIRLTGHWIGMFSRPPPGLLLLRRYLDHRGYGRLRFAITVKEQREVGSASYRPVILPGVFVAHAPEGHARDHAAMAGVNVEQVGPAAGNLLLNSLRQAARVRV